MNGREKMMNGREKMMNDDLAFLLEAVLSMNYEERGLHAALKDKPDDQTLRNAYGDWLEERGRVKGADLVRRGCTPGGGWWYGAMNFSSGEIGGGILVESGVLSSGQMPSLFYGEPQSGLVRAR